MIYEYTNGKEFIYKKWKKWVNIDERETEFIRYNIRPSLSKLSRKDQSNLLVRPALKHLDHHFYLLTTGKSFDQAYEFWSTKDWQCAQRQINSIRKLYRHYERLDGKNRKNSRINRALLLWCHDTKRSVESSDLQNHERNSTKSSAFLTKKEYNREHESSILWLIALIGVIGALLQKFIF